MAELVINLLEAVDVEIEHGSTHLVAMPCLRRIRHGGENGAPVEEAGQRVGRRFSAERDLTLVTLGDVPADCIEAGHTPISANLRDIALLDIASLGPGNHRSQEGHFLALQGSVDIGLHHVIDFRLNHVTDGATEDVIGLDAEDVVVFLVAIGVTLLRVDEGHQCRHGIGKGAQEVGGTFHLVMGVFGLVL